MSERTEIFSRIVRASLQKEYNCHIGIDEVTGKLIVPSWIPQDEIEEHFRAVEWRLNGGSKNG